MVDRAAFLVQVPGLFLGPSLARLRTLHSLDFARRFRVVRDRWLSLSHQHYAIFPEPHLLFPSRSGKVRESHLLDLPFQFSADFRAGTSRFLSRCMVRAKIAIVDCSGVVALVTA